tara:strand:+ start:235 stop:459 length:225 start_codon:yes stop_codon:yes gene_type:complete
MKITKARIKQLIKEEIEGLEEGGPHFHAKLATWLEDKLGPELGGLIAMAVDGSPHQDEIARLTDELIIAEGEER